MSLSVCERQRCEICLIITLTDALTVRYLEIYCLPILDIYTSSQTLNSMCLLCVYVLQTDLTNTTNMQEQKLPNNFLGCFLERTAPFKLGLKGIHRPDELYNLSSGSTLCFLPSRACIETLQREAPRRHLNQMYSTNHLS